MPATTHTCEFEGCNWKLETENLEHYISLLKIHVEAMHKQQRVSAKAEKAKRPELASEVSEEDWSYFTSRWEYYKKACGLTAEDTVTQLLECCNEGLRRDHHRTFSGANEVNDENAVLAQLKQIAVSKRNITVNRVKLGTLNQDRGETVRKFAGRVKSLASVSSYTVKCSKTGCNTDIVYQEPVIIDQVIRGLCDNEIQKDVLTRDRMDLENLLKYVEGKESALTSQGLIPGDAVAAANHEQRREQRRGQQGDQRRGQRSGQRGGQQGEQRRGHEHHDKCSWCGGPAHISRKDCKALDSECDTCGKIGHFSKVCRGNSKTKSKGGQGKPEFEPKRPLAPKAS